MAELTMDQLRADAGPTVRDQACLAVDARHGFTMEFAPFPESHVAEYGEEECRLRALQGLAHPEGCWCGGAQNA